MVTLKEQVLSCVFKERGYEKSGYSQRKHSFSAHAFTLRLFESVALDPMTWKAGHALTASLPPRNNC